jgi:Ca2+-binding RTX toxin-like protein
LGSFNSPYGNAGNVLTGYNGPDLLVGNGGVDTLKGDDGADTLNTSGDALQDQPSCGTGTGTVAANAEKLDGVSVDCETVHKS